MQNFALFNLMRPYLNTRCVVSELSGGLHILIFPSILDMA